MRIAIVGAGVSGLVCAHLLHDEHEVTVFEANDYAGGHTNTVRVDTEHETHHVDTGFIVLNDRTYPNFEKLLAGVGVATQGSNMSFSVSDGRDFEYNGASANGLFARRSNLARPSFHRMVVDLLRFNREAPALVGLNGSGPSLGEFLDEGGYSEQFVERLIVPQASAVWSADPRSMWEFPASMLAEFFANHGMFGRSDRPTWMTVKGGSKTYVDAIVRPFADRLRLSTPVRRIERFDDRVEVTPAGGEPRGVRRGRAGRALEPGAGHARGTERSRGRGARCDSLPAERDRAPHRPLAPAPPPPRLGELELPPPGAPRRADHGHLPHESPAVARRRS